MKARNKGGAIECVVIICLKYKPNYLKLLKIILNVSNVAFKMGYILLIVISAIRDY